MGNLSVVHQEGKIYSCKHCRTPSAFREDVVSKLISLDMGSLIAGAKYRGEFEDRHRLEAVLKEVTESDGQTILFIDEIHTVDGAAEWWLTYGNHVPTLQNIAVKVLSLTCSSSGCERNWSSFEQIHSKKRSKLEHQKLQDLVFVRYNQTIRERYISKDLIDPISLDNIDDCNEWFLGV